MEEKRRFRRYHGGSAFDLSFNNGLLKATAVDYSLSGAGVLVEDTPPIRSGDLIGVSLKEPEVTFNGEVVWSVQGKSGLRVGIRNLGQMRGLIRDFSFPDTLIGLQRSNKTGILTVQSCDIVKKVYIRDGDMVFSVSNQPEDRLGDVLLREGIISREQYDRSVVELKRTAQRQGSILVRLGYLNAAGLASAVRHQVESIILSIFSLDKAGFVFEETSMPTDEVITLKLSAANLIYYGIQSLRDPDSIGRDLPAEDSVPVFSGDPLNLFQDLRPDHLGKKILSCIDGKTSIREICSITQMDIPDALRTVYALLSIRMIDLRDAGGAFAEMPHEVLEEIVERKEERTIAPHMRELIEDTYQRLGSLDYYRILGVKQHASDTEIRSAYYGAAKKFHPDIHFSVTDDTLKDKLSAIFSYIYESYATLRNPSKRKEYDALMTLKPAALLSTQDKARAKFEEGKLELRKKNYADAALLFGQASYFDQWTADYHYYYGLALMKQDKFKDAEKAMEKALKLAPSNADYLSELGFVFLGLSFPTRAKAFFEKALKLDPENMRAKEGIEGIKTAGA